MHIILYGPSGSGKSTIGKSLAQALKMPFFDLDTSIEKETGQIIFHLIENEGEEVFRDLETRFLSKCLSGPEKVIALGGGALLRENNRNLAEKHGQVIFLDVKIDNLKKRLSKDGNQRPLLKGKLEESLKMLLENRQEHYASFQNRVNANQSLDKIVWSIQRMIGRYHLRSMGAAYDVLVQNGGLDYIGVLLKQRDIKGPLLVVSDENVAPLYAERVIESLQASGYIAQQLIIPAGEAHKSIDTIMSIWRGCLKENLDRNSSILALGGGVVGDLVGFSAATYMRGCRWINIPTTMLAMVDAGIGGKTGFDLKEGKNLVGAFYPPQFVMADPDVLSTLPERELCSGLAEVVKSGVISDPYLFNLCAQGWKNVLDNLPEVIRRALAVKVKVIEEDPYEKDVRAALNFGHTVGHAVELVSNFNLLHGEAVSIGMVVEAEIAERISIAEVGTKETIVDSLSKLGLPVEIPVSLPKADIIKVMKMDKKKADGIVYFALPVKIGEIKVGIGIRDLSTVLEEKK